MPAAVPAHLVNFPGPLVFAPSLQPTRLFLDLDDGDTHPPQPSAPYQVNRTVNRTVRANIHLPERCDSVFIKVLAHDISSLEDDEVVGRSFDETLTYLEQHYNGERHYVLHYVTAREADNLVRAASDDVRGAPPQYLDSVIPSQRTGRAAVAQAVRTDPSAL